MGVNIKVTPNPEKRIGILRIESAASTAINWYVSFGKLGYRHFSDHPDFSADPFSTGDSTPYVISHGDFSINTDNPPYPTGFPITGESLLGYRLTHPFYASSEKPIPRVIVFLQNEDMLIHMPSRPYSMDETFYIFRFLELMNLARGAVLHGAKQVMDAVNQGIFDPSEF